MGFQIQDSDHGNFPPGLQVPEESPPGGGLKPGGGPIQGTTDATEEDVDEDLPFNPPDPPLPGDMEELPPVYPQPEGNAIYGEGPPPDSGIEQIMGEIRDSVWSRASEEEKLYANLLLKTDFEEEFIEEMLEYEPDEESMERIQELVSETREGDNTPSQPMIISGPPIF